MQLPDRVLQACLWLLCIGELRAATFKLALLGPWSCDPMFSRAMPTAAANLALSRIQSDNSLNRGFSYSIKLLEEDCSVSKGESAYLTADWHSSKSLLSMKRLKGQSSFMGFCFNQNESIKQEHSKNFIIFTFLKFLKIK